jgi:hypothetical protein
MIKSIYYIPLQLAEEEEIRRLRKELIPKAQPMPYFDRPFIPRRYWLINITMNNLYIILAVSLGISFWDSDFTQLLHDTIIDLGHSILNQWRRLFKVDLMKGIMWTNWYQIDDRDQYCVLLRMRFALQWIQIHFFCHLLSNYFILIYRSMKHPTIPKEPKFHIPHHKKIKCLSLNEMRSYSSYFNWDFRKSFGDENVDDSICHFLISREIFNLYMVWTSNISCKFWCCCLWSIVVQ